MNPSYSEFKFPSIRQQSWHKVFRSRTPKEAVDLISKLLVYDPSKRLEPFDALVHPFFDELRQEGTTLPNGNPLPDLFNFSKEEIMQFDQKRTPELVPEWYARKVEAEEQARKLAEEQQMRGD